jgi:TRAP-type C4-dicarboxylate transport system substrate-binding protein
MTNRANKFVSRRAYLAGVSGIGLASIAGCAGSDTDSEVEMTVASGYPEAHIHGEHALMFEDRVEEESDGDIQVDVLAGGAMGSDDEVRELVREDSLEAHAGGYDPYLLYIPEYSPWVNPFVIGSWDTLVDWLESDDGQEAEAQLAEQANHRRLGNEIYRGWRHVTTNEEINNPDDMAGMTLRLPGLDAWVDIYTSLGVDSSSVALDELYSAVQTGVVDATEGEAEQILSFDLHEVQDYYNMVETHMTTGAIYASEAWYQDLDDTYQEILMEIGLETSEEATDIALNREEDLIDELAEDMTINEGPDRDAFVESAEPVIEEYFEEVWIGEWDDFQ